MSLPSWKDQLRQVLANLTNPDRGHPRIAILGIGNPLNGDDAVGGYIADRINRRLGSLGRKGSFDLYVANTGPVPENFTGAIRKFSPDLIVMVDAASIDPGQEPIQWIPLEAIAGFSASTHGMPLSMLANYLVEELKCQIGLIGIQARSTSPGPTGQSTMTPEVRAMAQKIVRFLARELSR